MSKDKSCCFQRWELSISRLRTGPGRPLIENILEEIWLLEKWLELMSWQLLLLFKQDDSTFFSTFQAFFSPCVKWGEGAFWLLRMLLPLTFSGSRASLCLLFACWLFLPPISAHLCLHPCLLSNIFFRMCHSNFLMMCKWEISKGGWVGSADVFCVARVNKKSSFFSNYF